MKTMPWGELRRFPTKEITELCPVTVTVNEEPTLVIGKVGQVVVLTDLHPRVQQMFLNLNEKVRLGMPASERVYFEDTHPKAEPAKEE